MTLAEKVKEAVKKAYQTAQAETAPPSFMDSIADALEREADAYIYRQRKGIAPVVLAGLADKEAAKLRTDADQAKAYWEKFKADRDSPESIERQAALAAAGALNFYSRAAMPALEIAEANYLRHALKLAALEAIAAHFRFLQPSKEALAAFRTEAAHVLSEAKAKAAAKTAERLGTLKAAAALYPAKERRAYLARKQAEQADFWAKERHPAIDLHGTDAETLTGILAAQLEDFAAGRSDTPAAYLIARLSELEAARLTAQALAAELEAKASSAEGMNDSETAEKARELLRKMEMLGSKDEINPPDDCEHDANAIARALYDALEKKMRGKGKRERFAQILKDKFGHSMSGRTLGNISKVRDRAQAERTLTKAFKALI
jgi:hypothetical protein